MDRRGRDQFVIRYADETEICWNDHQKQLAEQVVILIVSCTCLSVRQGTVWLSWPATPSVMQQHVCQSLLWLVVRDCWHHPSASCACA